MSLIADLAVAVAIAVGLVGIVVPVLPGVLLIFAAILVWAIVEGGAVAWTACVVAVAILAAAQVVKYTVPGSRLRAHGVPASTLAIAALLGIVGFFVLPVVGLVVGFVGGVYAAEAARLKDAGRAWESTVASVRAVGLSILIELAAGLLAAAVWAVGVVASGV